jgi:glycylpeptide N-tetradecanoyltransferase
MSSLTPFLADRALKPPGFIKDWHIGVRVTTTRKLVGFISGIPMQLRVRQVYVQLRSEDSQTKVLHREKRVSEINFLVVHKKLRAKRLAPVLIKEVTRRCHLQGIFQAIYTAGVYLPTPVSQCQYFHRSLDVKKLVDLGFSGVPRYKTLAGMIRENVLPTKTSTLGLREMELKDSPAVAQLLRKYMSRFDLAPVFSDEEVLHNFTSGRGTGESVDGRRPGQVVWTYVVEVRPP